MTKDYAPILLFVYKRLEHVQRVIDALRTNPEAADSVLYIYSDAPASDADAEGVEAVREYVRSISSFEKVIVVERENNFGIEKSEVDGVTTVIGRHGKVIVLEDDIQVGNQFLKYMNYCLNEYKSDKSIYTVTGYSFLKADKANEELFGLTRSFCAWGWGTWSDRWENLSRSLNKSDIRYVATHKSMLDNGQEFSYLLLHQYKNRYLTWDVAWYYSCCKNGGMTIFPYNSLINNIGMDGSGVHYNDGSKENRVEPINDRGEISFPLKFGKFEDTLRKVVAEKKAGDKKTILRQFKMIVRFWLNTIEILASGADRVEIKRG